MVRLTYRLDMTIVVDWDVNPQIKQTNMLRRNGAMGVSISYWTL